jgi:hypothetical protein
MQAFFEQVAEELRYRHKASFPPKLYQGSVCS